MLGSSGFEVALILILVIANGIFSMSELAVVSSRKARLQQKANEGSRKARIALALANAPDEFLSTVQVGITLISTLAGAFGGATLATRLGRLLKEIPWAAPYADTIAVT